MEPTFPLTPSPVDAYPSPHEANPMMTAAPLVSASPSGRLYGPARPSRAFPRPPAFRPGKGGITLKTKSSLKIGAVSVKPLDNGVWELRHYSGGRYIRRRVTCSEKDARAMAGHLNAGLLSGKGFLPGKEERSVVPGVGDGIAEAINLRSIRKATADGYARDGIIFANWIGEHYPAVKSWEDVKPSMVQAYANALEGRNRKGSKTPTRLAHDSVRLALAPVKMAWSYIRDNYPGVLQPLPKIKVKPAPRREIECLEAGEVERLLVWLEGKDPALYCMAALASLAGMRQLEIAALRRQDVDLEAGTVTITDTGRHKPKTRDSERTLPVCEELRFALAAVVKAQKIIPATGEIFVNRSGNLWVIDALVHLWGRKLKRAAVELKNPRYAEIPIHRLRSAFATMASKAGATDRLLKAYIGHSAGDVLGGHYRKIDLAELRTVSTLMDGWRSKAGEGQKECETSNIPTTPIAEVCAEA